MDLAGRHVFIIILATWNMVLAANPVNANGNHPGQMIAKRYQESDPTSEGTEEEEHIRVRRTFLLPLGIALGRSMSGSPIRDQAQSTDNKVANIPSGGNPLDFPYFTGFSDSRTGQTANYPFLKQALRGGNPALSNSGANPYQQPGTFNPFSNPANSQFINSANNPYLNPANNPYLNPANKPLLNPSNNPYLSPANNPYLNPANKPFLNPTNNPFLNPTSNPFLNPTNNPFLNPTNNPFLNPTNNPFLNPTNNPFLNPTNNPFLNPANGIFPNPPLGTGFPAINPAENPLDPSSPLYPLVLQLLRTSQTPTSQSTPESNALGDVLSRLLNNVSGSLGNTLSDLLGNGNKPGTGAPGTPGANPGANPAVNPGTPVVNPVINPGG